MMYFLSVAIPVTVVGGYMVFHARTLLKEHHEEQAYSDNLRVKSLLLDLTTNIYHYSTILAADKELISLLSARHSALEARRTLEAYSGFETLLSQDVSVTEVDVYTWNTSLPEGKYIHPITEELENTSWFQKAAASYSSFWTVETLTDRRQNQITELHFHKRIFLPKQNSYAILRLTVSNNHLKNRIENNGLSTVIWLNDNDFFYYTTEDYRKEALAAYHPGKNDYYLGEIDLDGQNVIGCIAPFQPVYTNDVFFIASLNYDANFNISRITSTYLAILFLVILITSIFIYAYSIYFSQRINTLRQTMHEASLGNYNITDTFIGEDEISEVFADLNIMIQDILHKETAALESRIQTQKLVNQQQKMEFKMLSSQINPHFLFNTLETIRMRSLKAGNREVANAIKLLGKSMRYVLQNTTTAFTTLDKELDYIETYLAIQKLRFHDRVNYSLKTPENLNLHEYQILPLLLQPIVENSILHGLEEVEQNGRIIIHIKRSDSDLLLTVYDNGRGMSAEEQHTMEENIWHHPKDSSKSIGLSNIHQRIHLCYGPEYGLLVKSRQGLGTAITITIPAQTAKGEKER